MGARSFMTIGYGKDMRQAYDNLVEESKMEYGCNAYNGTISTTYGFKVFNCVINCNMGPNWTKTKEKKAFEYARKNLDDLGNRECKGIDLGKVSRNITHHNGWHKFLFFGWAAE
jgi:hypothetical protein